MKTIGNFFNTIFTKENFENELDSFKKEFSRINSLFFEKLPYDLFDSYNDSLRYICRKIAEKSFKLGFSTATKLTAESFVSLENNKK